MLQAVQAADALAVDPAAVEMKDLGGAARARHDRADRLERGDRAAGLLERLAAHHLFRSLARLDDAGHCLDHPGSEPGGVGADAELLDQHHPIARRVVGQDHGGVAALEQLARHDLGPAAAEAPVAQAVGLDAEVTVVGDGPFEDLDVICAPGGIEHGLRSPEIPVAQTSPKPRCAPSTGKTLSESALEPAGAVHALRTSEIGPPQRAG